MASERGPLDHRDMLVADAGTGWRLLFDEGTRTPPLLTIAIPTFRREPLLREALASALAQDLKAVVEILVVDNDPATAGIAAQATAMLDPGHQRLRYVVNDANIGMFGNWNRCLSLAHGRWFTVLNDDDLLDPDFARRMLGVLETTPALDALICRKRVLDERPFGSRARRPAIAAAVLKAGAFRGRAWRHIGARQLFWGNVIGNSVGLVCRTTDLRALGGFDPGDYPSADYYVHARLATRHRLGQLAATLASIRVAENESMKPEVLYGFLRTGYRMQQALAAGSLPAWWARLSPALIARHVGELSAGWNVPLDRTRVERELGLRLPADHERGMKLLRLLLGGL